MAKRRYGMDERRIKIWTAQGRGAGSGIDYRPWLKIQDVPSKGRRHRPLGRTTGRVHHLLSDLELAAFLEADWQDDVVDIREQYPLDRAKTRRIAASIGVRHPRDPATQVDIVMTTDLVVDRMVSDEIRTEPHHMKYAHDLGSTRGAEKFEIERLYWLAEGTTLVATTEKELSIVRRETLAWLHAVHHVARHPWPYPGYWLTRSEELLQCLMLLDGRLPIGDIINRLEHSGRYHPGEVLSLIRFLASTKKIYIELDRRFDVRDPLSSIRFPIGSAV